MIRVYRIPSVVALRLEWIKLKKHTHWCRLCLYSSTFRQTQAGRYPPFPSRVEKFELCLGFFKFIPSTQYIFGAWGFLLYLNVQDWVCVDIAQNAFHVVYNLSMVNWTLKKTWKFSQVFYTKRERTSVYLGLVFWMVLYSVVVGHKANRTFENG